MTAPNSTLDDDPPPLSQPADLGFGSVVAQAVRGRFLNRDGRPNSKKYGLGAQRLARFYLASLDSSWTAFFLWMMGGLLLLNGCFALAYVALGTIWVSKHGQSAGNHSPVYLRSTFCLPVTTGSSETSTQEVILNI